MPSKKRKNDESADNDADIDDKKKIAKTSNRASKKAKNTSFENVEVDEDFEDSKSKLANEATRSKRNIQSREVKTVVNSKRNVDIENPSEAAGNDNKTRSVSNMKKTSRNIKIENPVTEVDAHIDEIKETKPNIKPTRKRNIKKTEISPVKAAPNVEEKPAPKVSRVKRKLDMDKLSNENESENIDVENPATKMSRAKKKVVMGKLSNENESGNIKIEDPATEVEAHIEEIKETRPNIKGTRKRNVTKTESSHVKAVLNVVKKSVPKVSRAKKKVTLDTSPSKNEPKMPVGNKNALVSVDRHLKTRKYVGAHTSIAGGLYKAIEEAEQLGAVAIGMFLKSQRTWKSKELDEKSIKLFKEKMQSSGILPEMIIPHGSYLLNCGSANEENLQKSRDCLVDELKRCELLGIPMYNFHPGSAKDTTVDRCIELIAESINIAHSQTKSVITLIENMSNQGSTIGGDFIQLKSIIDKVKDKSRVGICFDTCHAFAAGYDMRTEEGYERTKKEFNEVVGRKYLKAVHLNDSKGDVGCHLDRHENIGKGKLGLDFFKRIMNDPYFDDVAMVLETPEGDYKAEINLLYNLCD